MESNCKGKNIIIIGATGGLGSEFARAFAGRDAKLLLAGRNEEKLKQVRNETGGKADIAVVDITKEDSLNHLAEYVRKWTDRIDVVVNVSGYDVRKSLKDHSCEEIKHSLDVNLYGAILITKIMMPYMRDKKGSMIVHIGGFADGRMAFPYYTADVASRAGLFSFIESMNRELYTEGIKTRVAYFCPSPADTDAERPYHPLWRKMGIRILPTGKVSEALIKLIEKNKTTGIMGGFLTVIFARLNSVLPGLADIVVMKSYGRMLRRFLYDTGREADKV